MRYDAVWGRDRDGERRAFERFVDWLVERRRRYPGMHVYHYAHYERTALRRLMGEHGTREDEIDDFLRARGARRPLPRRRSRRSARRSTSYSIKAIEKLYGFERTAEVAGGDESIVLFEEWLETGDDALLEEIERYNEEDCRSTFALHEWLLGIRPPGLPWRDPPELRPRKEELEQRDAERAALEERLLAGAEEGDAAPAPRAPPRLPPARGEAAVVGVVPLAAARRRRARRGPDSDRRASSGTAGRPRSTGRATRTASRSPSRSTSSGRRGSTRTRESAFG